MKRRHGKQSSGERASPTGKPVDVKKASHASIPLQPRQSRNARRGK